jgi:hypothetical protein
MTGPPDIGDSSPKPAASGAGKYRVPNGVAGSYACLQELEDRLAEGFDISYEEANFGKYLLFEHLYRVSLAANRLLDQFEQDVEIPIEVGARYINYINPLLKIHQDLWPFFWKPGCLMEELADSKVDWSLREALIEMYKEWGRLRAAMDEYVQTRQSGKLTDNADARIITGQAFSSAFRDFVTLLMSLTSRSAFRTRHSRLAARLGITPPRKRGKVIKRARQ